MIVEHCYPLIYKEVTKKEITKLKAIFGEIFYIYDIERKISKDEKLEKCAAPASCFNMFEDEAYNKFVEKTVRKRITLKSELDMYMEDFFVKVVKDVEFDILDYWKTNAIKYKILSAMTKDILSIPMPSVASECAFSTRERLIRDHRSSLKSKIVEALICAQDWLPHIHTVESSEEIDEE